MVEGLMRERCFVRLLTIGVFACMLLAGGCSEEKGAAGPRKEPPEHGKAATDEDFAAEAQKVKKALGEDFIVEVEKPFVIAGNISRGEFEGIKTHTIMSCYSAFYRQFFQVKPDYILRVYLFKDDGTYREYAKRLFGDKPTTPLGYYSRENRSLVMNIGTGTGTLVHEMTHALIEPDFPEVPAWFNEGLGSLFEQCRVTPRGLKGLVNWRLPILRKAIKEDKLRGLRKLVATTSTQFYRDERGTNYAEARYFCMYMQERGLLEKFYRSFRDNFKEDPTGAKTIEKLFGKSLEEIQDDWVKWVAGLPERY